MCSVLLSAGLLCSVMTAQSSVQTPDPASGSTLLTDFRGGGKGLEWFTQHDTVMGGRSNGDFQVEDGVLRFTGYLNTNGGGFTSIRARRQDLDLSGHTGIHLRVRGDGRTYSVRLEQDEQRRFRSNYRAEFATVKSEGGAWQDVFLPFDTFIPTWRGRTLDRPAIDPAKINLIGVTLADKKDGDFAIEIEQMRAYKPFDLDQYRGEHRLLILTARDASDFGLIRQRIDLEQNRKGCAERDLMVLALFEEGTSYAGKRPLNADETKSTAKAFGLGLGRFSVSLVGNDGSMKMQEFGAVSADRLFAVIDAMPRRRAELRR